MRCIVDFHVQSVQYRAWNGQSLDSISPWPWPNISEMAVLTKRKEDYVHNRDVEHLATLPLLNLKCVSLYCRDVAPLVQSNWPMLTELELHIYPRREQQISWPKDLQFPKWNLKKLFLNAHEDVDNQTLAFVGPLLKSCPELANLNMRVHGRCTKELATGVVSAHLDQLEYLDIRGTGGRSNK